MLRDDRGSASLEFLTLGTLLIVPLAYLMLTLSALQGASIAGESAARSAARLLASDPESEETQALAAAAIDLAAADHGFEAGAVEQLVACDSPADTCQDAGAVVTVSVTIDVPLPFAPNLTGGAAPLSIPTSATSSFAVTRFGLST
ncbi:hypothetical protein [Pseudoclavibacter sp. RFBA6]|uniref:hypothetical protein n=1 Tax=Pseudoclavibacter sp. RFBA6 TaxID=2080573 RepID=UPI000CE79B8E|nr:hypothetical protein [Pseudoclavibacter sp. RFBA6]PPG39445.1 hypothetical protein C5C17_11670 [Pseudoclavibacter sp. RFBA6]